MKFKFHCTSCGEMHEGMPSFGAHAPLSYYKVPSDEREQRCRLGSDECVIDEKWFFVKGCIEIPVLGEEEVLSWGVWVSLSKQSYIQWLDAIKKEKRSHIGPFFGWLDAWLKPYPDTLNLKTTVHLRDRELRPYIELEPTDHRLAIEQHEGISVERVAEIYSIMVHEREA